MTNTPCKYCGHSMKDSHLPNHAEVCILCSPTCEEYAYLLEVERTLQDIEHEVSTVYWTLTNGKVTKPNTKSAYVLDVVEEELKDQYASLPEEYTKYFNAGHNLELLSKLGNVNVYKAGGYYISAGGKYFTGTVLFDVLEEAANWVKKEITK